MSLVLSLVMYSRGNCQSVVPGQIKYIQEDPEVYPGINIRAPSCFSQVWRVSVFAIYQDKIHGKSISGRKRESEGAGEAKDPFEKVG